MQLPRKSEHHKPGSDEQVPPMTIPWMQNEDFCLVGWWTCRSCLFLINVLNFMFFFTFFQECISWKQESCEGGGADRRIGHTITYDTEKKVLYVYGGSKTKRWFSDVNILDLQTNIWSAVKVCLIFKSCS